MLPIHQAGLWCAHYFLLPVPKACSSSTPTASCLLPQCTQKHVCFSIGHAGLVLLQSLIPFQSLVPGKYFLPLAPVAAGALSLATAVLLLFPFQMKKLGVLNAFPLEQFDLKEAAPPPQLILCMPI